MNLEEIRKQISPEEFLKVSTMRAWRWLDQDVLNRFVNGHYLRINMKWNHLVDWQFLRRDHIVAQAPKDVREEYEEARKNICIAHFAGPDNRPWLYPNSDLAGLFWFYARRSPYLEELRSQLEESRRTVRGLSHRVQSGVLFRGLMPLFDTVFPPGTKTRTQLITSYNKLGGGNL